MIIVLKNENGQLMINKLEKHFASDHQVFVHNNRVAVQGAHPADLTDEERAQASQIITDVPKAVQASVCSIRKTRLSRHHIL